MKFKSLTKLAMSGVALAAVATTLGASTYAWYVVNPTANVTNINAATANAGDTSILVSKNGTTFAGKIAFGDADYNGSGTSYAANNINNPFIPVRPKGATDLSAFYDATVEDVTATGATDTNAYLKFNVWVKAAKAQDVHVKLSVQNKTDKDTEASGQQLPTQYAYQDVSTSVHATDSFTVDAVHALRTAVIVNDNTTSGQTVYETDKVAYTPGYAAASKYTTVSLGDINDTTKITNSTATIVNEQGEEATITGLSGAHLYYTQVMSEEPVTKQDTATVSNGTEIADITLAAANTAVKLTFIIWLEGGDDLCFDACGGQNFEFGLQFDAVTA
jgi:hypothetical protein